MKNMSGAFAIAAVCALCVAVGTSAAGSGTSDVEFTIKKWVGDFNKGDMKHFLAACAPQVSVVDGFPPYAWPTCADRMKSYRENSEAIQLTAGRIWIGKPAYAEVTKDRAYMIYPATFSDQEQGKPVVYRGTWTLTLQKTASGWVFTGSASAWTQH